jgi:hypothetical protein
VTPQHPVTVVPITLPVANRFVSHFHRHHAPIPAGFVWFCIAAVVDESLRGVAIGGRPTNRNNDDQQTVEVLRVASDGTPNVPSALLGACGRVGRAMGASRVITYTLESESGSSLKAAGWCREADGIQSCWTRGSSRRRAVGREHMTELKVRWALNIRPPVSYVNPLTVVPDDQTVLDFRASV